MKVYFAGIMAFFLLFIISACEKGDSARDVSELSVEKPQPIEGTWELISQKAVLKDTTIVTDMSTMRQIKIISPSHYASVAQSVDGKEFIVGGGGRYTFSDNIYTETYEYFSITELVGRSISWNIRFEDDTFIQSGMFPVTKNKKELFTEEDEIRLIQTYRRIK